MSVFLGIFTYFSYIFIIVAYTVKIVKYLSLPIHLRWELYPVIHEENYLYGGSYYERIDWWGRPEKKRSFKGLLYLLKGYFTLDDYLKKNLFYWAGLFPWHMGFIFIITFHILCFLGALLMTFHVDISIDSPNPTGKIFFYIILIIGLFSFITGAIGSILVLINRWVDKNLRAYGTPLNYFMYIFTLVVFLSGLISWYFDPRFNEYREFWKGLIQWQFITPEIPTIVHIIIFNLFLIYLPFTRSLHYITRFFAFFLIRWDDKPNMPGGELEKRILEQLNNRLEWCAPHIIKDKPWKEQ